MDDLNLYDDLDEFQEQQDKKSKELREAEERYQQSLKSIEDLQKEKKKLEKNIQRIELSFQSLLDTARSEIKRKDKEIERLRKEKDDICFRRKIPSNTASRNENPCIASNFTINNPYKHSNIKDNDNSVEKIVVIPTCRSRDDHPESNKRIRSEDDERDPSKEYKRQCTSRSYYDDRYQRSTRKHARTWQKIEDDHGVSRSRKKDNHKESTSKKDYNRNRSRERRENGKTNSEDTYEKSSESNSVERYWKSSRRSRSRGREKDDKKGRTFERKQTQEHKNTYKFSKSASKSPTRRKKCHSDDNRDQYKTRKTTRTAEKGKGRKIYDKDLCKEKKKNFAPKNLQKENIERASNEKQNSDLINIRIPNTQAQNEETQKCPSVIRSDGKQSKYDNLLDKKSSNNVQLEKPAVNASTTETRKLCTPRKVDLFYEIFGKSPSECSLTRTNTINSNSFLNNIKDIIAKASQVINSGTTSPADYSDVNSFMSTPINKTIEIVSSNSNSPNSIVNRKNDQTTDRDEIDNCFILNRKLEQNVESIACVDLTKVVEDDIATEVDFIQIPGLDLLCSHSREFPVMDNTSASIQIEEICEAIDNEISKKNTDIISKATKETTIQATSTNNTKFIEVMDIEDDDILYGKHNIPKSSVANNDDSIKNFKTTDYNKELAKKMNEENETAANSSECVAQKEPINSKEKTTPNQFEDLNIKENLEMQTKDFICRNIESGKSLGNLPQTQDATTSKIAPIENISELAEKVKDVSHNLMNKVVIIEAINSSSIVPLKNPYKTDEDENALKNADKTKKSDEYFIETEMQNSGTNSKAAKAGQPSIGDKCKAYKEDDIKPQTKSINSISSISSVHETTLIDKAGSNEVEKSFTSKSYINESLLKAVNEKKTQVAASVVLESHGAPQSEKGNVSLFALASPDSTTDKTDCIRENLSVLSTNEIYMEEKAIKQSDKDLPKPDDAEVLQKTSSQLAEETQKANNTFANENIAVKIMETELLVESNLDKEEIFETNSHVKENSIEVISYSEETLRGIVEVVKTFSTETVVQVEQGNSSKLSESSSQEEESPTVEKLDEVVQINELSTHAIDTQIKNKNIFSPTEQGTSSNFDEFVKSVELFSSEKIVHVEDKNNSTITEQGTLSNLHTCTYIKEKSLSKENLEEIVQIDELRSQTEVVQIENKDLFSTTKKGTSSNSSEASAKEDHPSKMTYSEERKSHNKENLHEIVESAETLSHTGVVQVEEESLFSITEQETSLKLPERASQEEKSLSKELIKIVEIVVLPAQTDIVQAENRIFFSTMEQRTSSNSSEKSEEKKSINDTNLDTVSEIMERVYQMKVEHKNLSNTREQGNSSNLSQSASLEEKSLSKEKLNNIEKMVELSTQAKVVQPEKEDLLRTSERETSSNLILLLEEGDQDTELIDKNAIDVKTSKVDFSHEILTNIENETVKNERRNPHSVLDGNATASLSEIKHTFNKDFENNVSNIKLSEESTENSIIEPNKESVFKDINSEETIKCKSDEKTIPKFISTEVLETKISCIDLCNPESKTETLIVATSPSPATTVPRNKSFTFESVTPESNQDVISTIISSLHSRETNTCNNNDETGTKVILLEDAKNRTHPRDSCYSPTLGAITTKYSRVNVNNETNIDNYQQNQTESNVATSFQKSSVDDLKNMTLKLKVNNPAIFKTCRDLTTANIADLNSGKQINNNESKPKCPTNKMSKDYKKEDETQVDEKKCHILKPTQILHTYISSTLTQENLAESIELKDLKSISLKNETKKSNEENACDPTKEMTHKYSLTSTQNKLSELAIKLTDNNDASDSTSCTKENLTESVALKGNVTKEPKCIDEEMTSRNENEESTYDQQNKYNFSRNLITKEINIEGEIVDVVKNIVDLNGLQSISENIKMVKQSTATSHKIESYLEKEQQPDKQSIAKSPQNNAEDFDNKSSQIKPEISSSEFRNIDKIRVATISNKNVYLVNKEVQYQLTQLQQAYIQTEAALEENVLPTLPETLNTIHVLPSISTISPTPSNFSGIFSKKSSPIVTSEDELINSKKKSPNVSAKPKEYILPAASVLCNVDNLKNATKSNKKLHWELLDNKNVRTEIEDDADIDTSDDEKLKIKEEPLDEIFTHCKLQKSSPSETDTQAEDESIINCSRQQKRNYKKKKMSKISIIKQCKRKLSENVPAGLNANVMHNNESLIDSSLLAETPICIDLPERPAGRPRKQNETSEMNNDELRVHRKKKERKPKNIDENLKLQQELPESITLNSKWDIYPKETELEIKEVIQETESSESNKLESFDLQSTYDNAEKRQHEIIATNSLKSDNCVKNNSNPLDGKARNIPQTIKSLKNSMKILSRSVEKLEICDEPCVSKDSIYQQYDDDYNTLTIYHKQHSTTNDISTSKKEDRGAESNKQLEDKDNSELKEFIEKTNVSPKSLSGKKTQDINLINGNNYDKVCVSDDKPVNDKVIDSKNVPTITESLLSSNNVAAQENYAINRSNSETDKILSEKQQDLKQDKSLKSQSLAKPLFKHKSKYSKNKVKNFISLQDIGIKVCPPYHLSSFRIPKIKKDSEDTIGSSCKLENYVEVGNEGSKEQFKKCNEQEKKVEHIPQEKKHLENYQKFSDNKKVSNSPKETKEKSHMNLNKIDKHETKKLSEKEAESSTGNYITNFENTTKTGKRKLFSSDICKGRDIKGNAETTIENKRPETASDQQLYPSQTYEQKTIEIRRKSLHVEKHGINSDSCETVSSSNSTKPLKKTINLHRRILDSSTEEDNDKEMKTNKEKLLNKNAKTSKLEVNLENYVKEQTKYSDLSTNKSKVRRKSMYEELEVANSKIDRTSKTIADLKFPVEQESAIKLTNKNDDTQQPINAIKSFKMHKKSMDVESKSVKINSPKLEQMTNLANFNECNKSVNKYDTGLLNIKDENKNIENTSTLRKNLKETSELTKPIASVKMGGKSEYVERSKFYNKEDKKDAIKSLEKKDEDTIPDQKRGSNISVATKQQNSVNIRRKFTNIDRESWNVQDPPKNDRAVPQDFQVKKKHKDDVNNGDSTQPNTGSDSYNILTSQSLIIKRRKSINQGGNKDLCNTDSNSLNKQENNESFKESTKSKHEAKKKTNELRFEIGDNQKTKPDVDSSIVKPQHEAIETLIKKVVRNKAELKEFTKELQEKSKDLHHSDHFNREKEHLVKASEKKLIKLRRKSTNQSHTSDSQSTDSGGTIDIHKVNIYNKLLTKPTEISKQLSNQYSILTQPKPSKIHESKSAVNAEVKQKSDHKPVDPNTNFSVSYNLRETLHSTSELLEQKAIKIRRASANQCQSPVNQLKTNEPKQSQQRLQATSEASKLESGIGPTLEADYDLSVTKVQQKTIRPHRKSTNQRIIVASSSDDNAPLIKKSAVITSEIIIPLTPVAQQRRRRVVKVLSTSLDSSANATNSSHNSSSSLTSPCHPIFNTEVSTQSIEFAASLPVTSNDQNDNKLKEIDSKLDEIFRSPTNTVTYKVPPDVAVHNQTSLPPPSEFLHNETKDETVDFNRENDKSCLNVSQVNESISSLTDTTTVYNNSEIKHLSLGSAEYRFEKVSDNVINLFISRKRKRKAQ